VSRAQVSDINPFVTARNLVRRATAGFARRNQRFDMRPLVIRQFVRIPQVITIVFASVLKCPNSRLASNRTAFPESQMIQ